MLFIIAGRKSAPVKKLQKFLLIFFIHLIRLSAFIEIHIFSVNPRDSSHILRLFHPALDLQRVHAVFDQFRQFPDRTEIFWTEQIILSSVV